jgi:hypothetical protein
MIRLFNGEYALAVRPDQIVGVQIHIVESRQTLAGSPTHLIAVTTLDGGFLTLLVDSLEEAKEAFATLCSAADNAHLPFFSALTAVAGEQLARASSD